MEIGITAVSIRLFVSSWRFQIRTMHCPPTQGFYDNLVQMCIYPAEKSIYGQIFVNFSLDHGDMNKRCFDKIVDIILEFPSQNNALPSPTGILP